MASVSDEAIYHLCAASELRPGIEAGRYTPARFAEDGFVHCAQHPVVLSVASDYFGQVSEPVVLMRLDPARLSAELRFEAAAPIEGGGTAHLREAAQFPHVYGPIELTAVTGVAELPRSGAGFAWPERFVSLSDVLAHDR